ncbi:MAG: TetR/AcrR family transcriptional regulator [Anaerolineales bacterium]|nr:TetR/AcrR family transcriptional regulator [Anaerolineae bacterium]PWB49756.1 MAG: TetR/AcrR family transcriptional regulator [Anaerolineales bacterium]
MARIVNPEEHEMRRAEILGAAERLIYTRGYEQVSIQDILRELKISKGAFYHYFDSKQALLEAIIERMASQVLQLLQPILQDEHLSAPEKLRCVFDAASRWKTDRKEVLLSMISVWYADENAILRHKAQAALLPPIADIITSIIRQGVGEGQFHTAFPDQASTILFALLQSFGDSLVKMLVQPEPAPESLPRLEALSASHQDAVESILGARPGSLPLFDTSILREWFPLSSDNINH